MARYFKVVEIDRDSFIGAMDEDLDCCTIAKIVQKICLSTAGVRWI